MLGFFVSADGFGGQGNSFHGRGGRGSKRAQMRHCLRLMRSVVSTEDEVVLQDMSDQGAINQLLGMSAILILECDGMSAILILQCDGMSAILILECNGMSAILILECDGMSAILILECDGQIHASSGCRHFVIPLLIASFV